MTAALAPPNGPPITAPPASASVNRASFSPGLNSLPAPSSMLINVPSCPASIKPSAIATWTIWLATLVPYVFCAYFCIVSMPSFPTTASGTPLIKIPIPRFSSKPAIKPPLYDSLIRSSLDSPSISLRFASSSAPNTTGDNKPADAILTSIGDPLAPAVVFAQLIKSEKLPISSKRLGLNPSPSAAFK